MENLESGKDKIKKICEIIKNETLAPAKEEANRIIQSANEEGHQIVQEATQKAEELIRQAYVKIENEKKLFESSIEQASKQVIETLRQKIEKELFNQALDSWVHKETQTPEVAATLISALASALEKEGVNADFSAIIAKNVSKERVNALLAKSILDKLREKSVVLGEIGGGAQIKLHNQMLTLDLSDMAFKELLGGYLRKDFRALLFRA